MLEPAKHSKEYDRWLFFFFIALLIWIPLPLASNKLWASSLLCMVSFSLTAWWLTLFSLNRVEISESLKKSLPIILLLSFAPLWAFAQSLLSSEYLGASIDRSSSLHDAALGVSFILIFCLTLLLASSKSRLKVLAYSLIFSGLFQAVYGSMMSLTGIEYSFFVPKEAYTNLATGTFINRNHLAGYLVLTLSVGIGIMISSLNTSSVSGWRAHSRRLLATLLGPKARLRVMLIIMVAGLVMTHSRMGNTAFFASLAITGVLALILGKHSTRSTIMLISSLIVIDIFVMGTFFGVDKVADRLQNTSEASETRDEVNTYTLDAIQDNLWVGSGAGTYYTNFPQYREYDAGRGFYDHAHNDYFEFASDYGVIVTGCLIAAVLLVFISALRALKSRKNTLMRGLAFSAAMAVIALAIHSTVDFNLQIPANAATFMVILALGQISLYQKNRKVKS
ncbi:O-antigen ligase family protein [Amphritea balenae]|nr:O-antigen ligase family protein [Amphritea balenae]GGK77553.1 polymerase [Amphritea balenae]